MKKLSLKVEDLEEKIAPVLMLPNGNEVFVGEDNPAPFDKHPSIDSEVPGQGAPGPWVTHLGGPFS
jgi:hypothetical protein